MSEINNLKDVLKRSPRSNTYANALQGLGQVYHGGSQATGYSPLIDKLNEGKQENFCLACVTAGQPCSQHLKKDPPVMGVEELVGGVQYTGSPQMGGVYLMVDLTNPQSYLSAQAILKAVAQYYAKHSGKDAKYAGADYKGSSSYKSETSAKGDGK